MNDFPTPGYPTPDRPAAPPEFAPPSWQPHRPISPPHYPPLPVVPFDPANPRDDVFNRLLDHRIVLVTGRIDARTMTDVAAQLMLLDATGDDLIELRLMCPGGDLDSALALADTIDLVGVEVRACATGVVGGAALGPFVAATRRVAHPHATFILRDPEVSVTGRAWDSALAVASHEGQLACLHRRLAEACGQRQDRIVEDMQHGLLLSAAGAVDYGLVGELVRPA